MEEDTQDQNIPGVGRCRSARAPQPPIACSWWEKVAAMERPSCPTAKRHQGAKGGQRPPAQRGSGESRVEGRRRHKLPRLAVLPPHLQRWTRAIRAPGRPPRCVGRRPCPGTIPGCWALHPATRCRTLRRPPLHTARPERTRPRKITRKRRGARERRRPAVVAKDPAKREQRSTHGIQPLPQPGRHWPAAPSALRAEPALTWNPRRSASATRSPAPSRASLFTLPREQSEPALAWASPKEAPS